MTLIIKGKHNRKRDTDTDNINLAQRHTTPQTKNVYDDMSLLT
ncbi:hypothetical protein PPBDW_I20415 [Photobacterium kishitanii]|nr:hypothetical protein PPBDW_I20415 [Photobacterium kishitanii]